jgi:hypothetical protein
LKEISGLGTSNGRCDRRTPKYSFENCRQLSNTNLSLTNTIHSGKLQWCTKQARNYYSNYRVKRVTNQAQPHIRILYFTTVIRNNSSFVSWCRSEKCFQKPNVSSSMSVLLLLTNQMSVLPCQYFSY